ncbi:PilX N-terminal [Modicisalibacter muralis]|uniref:PilX N-terminal n=1 Tax=Modicisalibacter muralis TaxID=119000 RepID=A0A1G9QKX0_9GAMM|nr:PilX N-terminal domain-containing pilus assembly protein [Halomonas muralis]SDM11642.1 PilX N-terminal [Halomonas muralis]
MKPSREARAGQRRNQRGAALLITLVLVALVSVLAFSNSQTTRLQQHLSSNEHASRIAFQAAEAALQAAEARLDAADGIDKLAAVCLGGAADTYEILSAEALEEDAHWQDVAEQGAVANFALSTGLSLSRQPRYMIGCIAKTAIEGYMSSGGMVKGQAPEITDPRYFFRVFAVGFGPGARMKRILEARYVY